MADKVHLIKNYHIHDVLKFTDVLWRIGATTHFMTSSEFFRRIAS
jgi:hypothetical protein